MSQQGNKKRPLAKIKCSKQCTKKMQYKEQNVELKNDSYISHMKEFDMMSCEIVKLIHFGPMVAGSLTQKQQYQMFWVLL